MTDDVLSLRKQEQLDGLRLSLYSDGTHIDELVFGEAKSRLSDLLERKEYDGERVNLVIVREISDPAKSADDISKVLGYRPHLQNLDLITSRSFFSSEGVKGDFLFCANRVFAETSYVGPLLLHEFAHEMDAGNVHPGVRRHSFGLKMDPGFETLSYYNQNMFKVFIDYLTAPIQAPLTIKSDILANEKAMKLSSPGYMTPYLHAGSTEYRKFRERDQSRWDELRQKFEDISDVLGYDVLRGMQLAAHTKTLHHFMQYSVPFKRFETAPPSIIVENIQKSVPEKMLKHAKEVENLYSGLPGALDVATASKLYDGAQRIIERVFEDDGLKFPFVYEPRWGR